MVLTHSGPCPPRPGARVLAGGRGVFPCAAVLVLIAGSPCQQLTRAGQYEGKQGSAVQSSLYYAVPLIAWATAELRRDLRVHVVLENAGTTLPMHTQAPLAGLRLDEGNAPGGDRDLHSS